MASAGPEARSDKKEKKEKKDKKRKQSDVAQDGDDVVVVSEKKTKKDKKRKSTDAEALAVADVDGDVVIADAGAKAEDEDEDDKTKVVKVEIPLAALVPFANPLCGDKEGKKVLKSVKRAAKHKHITRGVKETVKAIRKSPVANPSTFTGGTLPHGIVILAADISPMDVISHIPVLCEDHNIPYVYVPSRAELGAAGSTKRPTSVVMLTEGKRGSGAKKEESEDAEAVKEWEETYRDLHRLAVKMGQTVKV